MLLFILTVWVFTCLFFLSRFRSSYLWPYIISELESSLRLVYLTKSIEQCKFRTLGNRFGSTLFLFYLREGEKRMPYEKIYKFHVLRMHGFVSTEYKKCDIESQPV